MSIEKLSLTTPPSRFFQGLSTDYSEQMTYTEFLLGIMKKLNEVVAQTNQNTEFINNYTGKIEELEAELNQLKIDLPIEMDAKLATLKTEIELEIASALSIAKAYTDTRTNQLQSQIDNIVVGAIQVYDPTTGLYVSLQTALDNIYGASRENALTATEYDGLELTATYYDGLQLTAFDYDNNAKSILMA